MRNERNVVRIIRFTAVFFALITPSTFKKGWCAPPIAASSSRLAIIVCGVAHTIHVVPDPRVKCRKEDQELRPRGWGCAVREEEGAGELLGELVVLGAPAD